MTTPPLPPDTRNVAFFDDGIGDDGFQTATVTEAPDAQAQAKASAVDPATPFPLPIEKGISKENLARLRNFLDDTIQRLKTKLDDKELEWAEQEELYRAVEEGIKTVPFEGACNLVVPLIAMGVDPIVARFNVSILKADPIIKLKALRKDMVATVPALERFINLYLRHRVDARTVFAPRFLELAKHGTCFVKTLYEREVYNTVSYAPGWNAVKTPVVHFEGMRVSGVSLKNLLFPPGYQRIQDCPFVAERHRLTPHQLRAGVGARQLDKTGVELVVNDTAWETSALEDERAASANHGATLLDDEGRVTVYECWFDFDIDDDGINERLVVLYQPDRRQLLQLRYNWTLNQRKPYTAIPYMIASDTIYGIGIAEMNRAFQRWLTLWQQTATDNAYSANQRMYGVRKGSGIAEAGLKVYANRVIPLDNPKDDLVPIQVGNTYPSTIQERQNLFGMSEKRTGVSDYLTGRESPIVGSRATATSTMALIQEGKARVEDVLENIRGGIAEVTYNILYGMSKFGTGGLEDIWLDDAEAALVKRFFSNLTAAGIEGALGVDLAVSDAANNKVVQQQTQLAVIQVLMTYLEKVTQLATMAAQNPQFRPIALEVMKSGHTAFKELLTTYDIRNIDQYLPDPEQLLAALAGNVPPNAGGPNGASPVGPAGAGIEPRLEAFLGASPGAGALGNGPPPSGAGPDGNSFLPS